MSITRPTVTLVERGSELRDPCEQLRLLRQVPLPDEFEDRLTCTDLSPLHASGIEVLQVNVGKLCNMTCQHCHVDAGPDRTDEMMERATFERLLEVLADSDIPTVDITGGAPELHPEFRWFVSEVRRLDRHVMSRCNLTILLSAPHRDLPRFFADHEVEIVASLPHYRPADTDRQRGEGTFAASIEAIRRLNDVGYGKGDERLQLDLVMNPVGICLPGPQALLEAEWQEALLRDHDVSFDQLFTITNMPISRFLEFLVASDNLDPYLRNLYDAFNPQAAGGVMCRTTLSVGWDGRLYDCDFNQMLELTVDHGLPTNIHDTNLDRFLDRRIVTGRHCFGCTAGEGSSCGGSIAG